MCDDPLLQDKYISRLFHVTTNLAPKTVYILAEMWRKLQSRIECNVFLQLTYTNIGRRLVDLIGFWWGPYLGHWCWWCVLWLTLHYHTRPCTETHLCRLLLLSGSQLAPVCVWYFHPCVFHSLWSSTCQGRPAQHCFAARPRAPGRTC